MGDRMTTVTGVSAQSTTSTRWIQLVLGLIAMMSISSPQYVWTLFTKPLQETLGAQLSAIQVTFTLVIVLQTFLSPLQGYLVDRFGARLLIAAGCLLSGLGWITAAYATSLTGLYLTYGLFCGIGVCFDCLVDVGDERAVRACLVPVGDGDEVRTCASPGISA